MQENFTRRPFLPPVLMHQRKYALLKQFVETLTRDIYLGELELVGGSPCPSCSIEIFRGIQITQYGSFHEYVSMSPTIPSRTGYDHISVVQRPLRPHPRDTVLGDCRRIDVLWTQLQKVRRHRFSVGISRGCLSPCKSLERIGAR